MLSASVPGAAAPERQQFSTPTIHRRRRHDGGEFGEIPPQVRHALIAPGRAIDSETRQFLEPRFGHDFGRVRIHVDSAAAESVQAQAFTVGHHIVFAAHHYAPETTAGLRLLAHELTHVVQQGAVSGGHAPMSAMVSVQRKPTLPYPGRILSLAEIAKDPEREKQRDNTKQTDAKACRSIGRTTTSDNCPATLAPGEKVKVTDEKVAGLWLQIENNGIANFGPKERVNVLGAFVGPIVEPAVVPKADADPPKTEAAPPAPPGEPSLTDRLLARLAQLPPKKRWTGGNVKGRAFVAINSLMVAKDFWFHEPTDRETASKIISRVKANFADVYLTDEKFDKVYGQINGLARGAFEQILRGARGAIKRLANDTTTGKDEETEAGWDYQLSQLSLASEVMETLAGDLAISDTKYIKPYVTMTGLKGGAAFLDGLLVGIRSQLSEEDAKKLGMKIAEAQGISALAPQIILTGALVGIAKDIRDVFKGLYEVVTNFEEMATNMASLMEVLLFDEEAARGFGEAMGADKGKDILKLAGEEVVQFTYHLGEIVGPTVVYTVLALTGVGALASAAVSERLALFLQKFPKAAKFLATAKRLVTFKKAVKAVEEIGEGEKVGGEAAKVAKGSRSLPKAPVPGKGAAPSGLAKGAEDAASTAKIAKDEAKLSEASKATPGPPEKGAPLRGTGAAETARTGRLGSVFRKLATGEGGAIFTDKEMATLYVTEHPDLPGLRAALEDLGVALVEKPPVVEESLLSTAASADIRYVKVTGPDGASFARAVIRYKPRAALQDIWHELNHLLDFQAGKIPPAYSVVAEDASRYSALQARTPESLMEVAEAAAPKIAARSVAELGQIQARQCIAEMRNHLRDIEELLHASDSAYVENAQKAVKYYRNSLESMIETGNVRGPRVLEAAEKAALKDFIKSYVAEKFPDLPAAFEHEFPPQKFWDFLK